MTKDRRILSVSYTHQDVYKRQAKDTVDVVLMDPPRSGSTEEFIRAVAAVKAKRVVYISCGPETLARDLEIFAKYGYRAQGAWPVDMFAFVDHTECIVKLERVN